MPGLVDLAEERFSDLELRDNNFGDAYQEVVGRIGEEGGDGELLLVLYLCQSLRSNPALGRYLERSGVLITRQISDSIVVPFGMHGYALVLLDPTRRRSRFRQAPIFETSLYPRDVLRLAFDPDRRFAPNATPWLNRPRHPDSLVNGIQPRVLEAAIVSVARRLTLGMIVARQPRWRPLAARVGDNGMLLGSIGVVGTDTFGNKVATTASHVVAGHSNVDVDGVKCAVVANDPHVDMAVLNIQQTTLAVRVPAGVRTDAPGVRNPVTFDGAMTPMRTTRISGIDPSVVAPTRLFASRVYTDPDAVDGDSGCALLDGQNKLIGFCSELTPIPSDFEAVTWIWADQALTRSRVVV